MNLATRTFILGLILLFFGGLALGFLYNDLKLHPYRIDLWLMAIGSALTALNGWEKIKKTTL